jgi:hypothetical protein
MDNFPEWFPWLFGGGTVVTILFTVGIIICSHIPFVAIFGGIAYYIRNRSKQATAIRQDSLNWLQTTGVVVTSRVEVSGGDHSSVSPRVKYQYTVGAQAYQSDQIKAGDHVFRVSVSGEAYDVVDRYPVGAQVAVFYNPANPAQACLER